MQFEETDFHLSVMLNTVQSIASESAQGKGLSFVIDAGQVPMWLRGDPTRLQQAL